MSCFTSYFSLRRDTKKRTKETPKSPLFTGIAQHASCVYAKRKNGGG